MININDEIFGLKLNFDIKEIHETSKQILSEIGICIGSEKGLKILETIGCNIDHNSKNVKISGPIIEKALSLVTPLKKIYNRTGDEFIDLSGKNVNFSSGAATVRILKYDGKYRNPTLKDLRDMTKIHDYYKDIAIYGNIVDPLDIDMKAYRTQIAAEMIKNTTKPLNFVANDAETVEDIFKMGMVIRDDKKNLTDKPFFYIGASAEGVLGYMAEECDLLIRCSELGIPTNGSSYPIVGLTAPLSISGALALSNANFLAALVIQTLVNPENPTMYPVQAGVYDMKTSNVITSSPEIWLSYIMGIKLGKYYNLPVEVLVSSDSKYPDLQMAYEKTMGFNICASAGANNIGGATCELDGMNIASYEQIIIDNEMISSMHHYFNKFKINTRLTDFEIIKDSINNKAYFLESEDTLKNYKKDLWDSSVFIKDNFINWENKDMPSVIDNAHQKVEKVLSEHKVPELSGVEIKQIDKIVSDSIKR